MHRDDLIYSTRVNAFVNRLTIGTIRAESSRDSLNVTVASRLTQVEKFDSRIRESESAAMHDAICRLGTHST